MRGALLALAGQVQAQSGLVTEIQGVDGDPEPDNNDDFVLTPRLRAEPDASVAPADAAPPPPPDACAPSPETCNGLDDDCDGETDEDFDDAEAEATRLYEETLELLSAWGDETVFYANPFLGP